MTELGMMRPRWWSGRRGLCRSSDLKMPNIPSQGRPSKIGAGWLRMRAAELGVGHGPCTPS